MIAPVYRLFNEGFDTPVLQEAKGLLDQTELSGCHSVASSIQA
jgi:hypothetical protein